MSLFASFKISENAFSVLARTSYCQNHLTKIIITMTRQTLKESKPDVKGKAVNRGIQRAIIKTDSSMELRRAKSSKRPPENKSVSLGRISNITKIIVASWATDTILSLVRYLFII